jgi:ankyrin repeat protein
MTPTERSDGAGRLAAPAGFLPPLLLSLLPLLHPHPAFGAGPLLALPLFLLAAVQAAGYRYEPTWFAALRERGLAAGLATWLAAAGSAVLLGWPAWRLLQTGALGAVLMCSLAAALALLALWRAWPVFGLIFLWDEATVTGAFATPARCLRIARNVPDSHEGDGLRGLGAAVALLLLCGGAAALAWDGMWPDPLMRRYALLAWALVLAPVAAWAAIELTAQRLLEEEAEAPAEAAVTLEFSPPSTPIEGATVTDKLYAAARAGRVEDALALLDAGADPYALPDPAARDQRALPVLAVLLADLRLLRALIGARIDLNLRHAGLTPLLAATRDSWHGRPEAVMTLLANGADPRLADAEGRAPLHGAALSVDPAVAALLLDAGAPLDPIDPEGWSPLGVACANGNWRQAKFLLERHAKPEPEGGQPALLAAAGGEDDAAGVKLLLKFKARVDARGRLNRSALHVACLAGNPQIAQALLEAGADVNARDEHGITPLIEATRAGSIETLRMLAARRPDAAAVDNLGRNALAIACQSARGGVETVDQLIAMGVDPAQPCRDGRLPIDYAVAAGRWARVARLDPAYPLPACVADAGEELADVPPLARLRVALEAHRHDHLRELVPMLRDEAEAIADLLLELAPRVDVGSLRLVLPACEHVIDARGDTLLFRLFDLGPEAALAIATLLERGAQPGGSGGLARYLAGAGPAAAAFATLVAPSREAPAVPDATRPGANIDIASAASGAPALSDASPALADEAASASAFTAAAVAVFGTPKALPAAPVPEAASAPAANPFASTEAAQPADGRDPAPSSARQASGFAWTPMAAPVSARALVHARATHAAALRAGACAPAAAVDEHAAERVALDLLARGADAFARSADRTPTLILAIRRDWPRLVEALLAVGVDPEARDARGNTALLTACALGHEDAVRALVAHGAQPGTRAADGQTALGLALASGRREIARWLEWPRWSPPRRALRGADLPQAAQEGDLDAVRRLLDLGLPLHAVDAQGCTALLRACGGGHLALVQLLLERGADPALPSRSGATCVSAALSMKHDAVLQALLARGADPNQSLPGGITPLMVAAALGQAKGVQALLAHGADAGAADGEGGTALHAAAQYGFAARDRTRVVPVWEALLSTGAEPDAANDAGYTPLLLLLGARAEPGAACDEDTLLAQLEKLLARQVSLSAQDRRGFGPLHLAALHGLSRVLRTLLAAGADPDLRDAINRRPQEIALMRGFVDIAQEFEPPKAAPSIARFLRT